MVVCATNSYGIFFARGEDFVESQKTTFSHMQMVKSWLRDKLSDENIDNI